MEILAVLTVGIVLGAVCGAVGSRPAAVVALRKDLVQVGRWLFAPVPVADPEPEYVGRHRLVEGPEVDAVGELVLGLEFR